MRACQRWGLIVASVALLGTACGSAHSPGAQSKLQLQPAASAAGNEQAAKREAANLLSLVRVPPGAEPVGPVTGLLSRPLVTPGVQSLVDRSRFWRVRTGFAAVLAWLRAHQPAGLKPDTLISEGLGPGGTRYSGDSYASPEPAAAWSAADLWIAVASSGSGSLIRADAMVTWLDPVPARDDAAGRRLHVASTGPCPPGDAGVVGVSNPKEHLTDRLLPAGNPSGALVCRYYGLNGPAFKLRHQSRLDAAAAQKLAAAVAALPLAHPDGGAVSCPNDDGSSALVALSYPGGGDVDLWVLLGGCGGVGNGVISTGSGDLPALILSLG